jgi:hypothetical protein
VLPSRTQLAIGALGYLVTPNGHWSKSPVRRRARDTRRSVPFVSQLIGILLKRCISVLSLDQGQLFGIVVIQANPASDEIDNGLIGRYFITDAGDNAQHDS